MYDQRDRYNFDEFFFIFIELLVLIMREKFDIFDDVEVCLWNKYMLKYDMVNIYE